MQKKYTPTFLFVILFSILPFFMHAQEVNIPDVNFKAKLLNASTIDSIARDSLGNNIKVDINDDGEIQSSEAKRVYELNIQGKSGSLGLIIDLSGIVEFINLKKLNCSFNKLTLLDVSGLLNLQTLLCHSNRISIMNLGTSTNLKELRCGSNQLTSLNLNGLTNLNYLVCATNQLTSLNLNGLINLNYLSCSSNQLTSLNLSGFANLKYLYCIYNQLTTLDLSGCTNLEILNCSNNSISNLNISGSLNLITVECRYNSLSSLDVNSNIDMETLDCSDNLILNLDVNGCKNLKSIKCQNCLISNLEISNCKNIEYINCSNNSLTTLDVKGCERLNTLNCQTNSIAVLDLSDHKSLEYLYCSYNSMTSLDVSYCRNLFHLYCGINSLSFLDVSGCLYLHKLFCSNNLLTILDITSLVQLQELDCRSNSLVIFFMKNGIDNSLDILSSKFSLSGNPSLYYVCADVLEINALRQKGLTSININSLCSATIDGSYYTMQSNIKYDANNNGCSSSDSALPHLKIKIQNAFDVGYAISDDQGNFAMNLDSGMYTITPIISDDYFICSPTNTIVSFPEDTIPQEFCITPNGTHHDVSVSIIPIQPARPGFSNATYKIVLTNKGNQIENGVITFNYDEARQEFITATKTPITVSNGQLVFNFSNLQLFESQEVIVTFKTNSPVENPPVNAGDVLILNVTAILNDEIRDDWFKDNFQEIDQTVVGSIDPNDKICLEGKIISPALIGDYVNYLIRFENTGTANAENVVVTDLIDINTFDISSIELVSASHSCKTLISEGNKILFVFNNINLPFTEPDKHGYVAFKIKLKENLIVGDSLRNNADIYFDYNLPVKTNTVTSNISNITDVINVANKNGRLSSYPNPTNGSFTFDYIASGNYTITITLFDITGKVVYTNELQHQNKSIQPIEVNNLPSGIYHLQVNSPFGVANNKVVIE